jgi:myosin-5
VFVIVVASLLLHFLDHPSVFYYTNQGEAPVINGVDDAEDFVSTVEALSLLGINEVRQKEIFRILSAILHMGNLMFKEEDEESCVLPVCSPVPDFR